MVDIRRLDDATVERIAAGEVVERPASAVKELVENSLDADASRVDVRVESGGKDGIRVADDGIGMTETEARRAVEQHTTSKIRDISDLEAGVGTLGFRGEALHAVGAVSRLTVTTRPRAGRDVDSPGGTELVVEGGEVTGVEPAGCPEGTTIEVDDLFYNVPARKKYLKQDGTEFAHVNRVVTSYALANPEVAVSLSHDGRETFATTGAGDRREAVMAVYGREVAESMVAVEARVAREGDPDSDDSDATALPDGPLDGVSGLVSHPETTRASREYLSTYVNGRYVTAGAVRDAVVEAYDTQLAPDRYPFAVLFLDVPAGDVDVNVHPRKLDVRFADEEAVREQIHTAVESALLEAGLLRSGAPRGNSAPEQAAIVPESDRSTPAEDGGDETDDRGPEGRNDDRGADRSVTADRAETGRPGTGRRSDGDRVSPETAGSGGETTRSLASDHGDSTVERPDSPERPASPSDAPPVGASGSAGEQAAGSDGERRTDRGETEVGAECDAPPETGRKFSGGDEQARLGDAPPAATEFDALPSLRVLGQLQDTYVVAETDDGLVLVDQHAADERINYERLKERFAGETTTQALAEPVKLELTAGEAALFDAYEDALARLGFRATLVDDRTVEVTTVPALVAESAGPAVVRDVLSDLVSGDRAAEGTVEAVADELLSDMACYPSITGNTSLTDGSVVDLLARLDDCENPWACPHGRPVLIHVDAAEIEDRFERDYPGHQ
jgi:DNA mismatch repair protein MutL